MPRERTDQAAFLIPRPIGEIVATFLVDADHPLCVQARSQLGVQQFSRGPEFDMIVGIMTNDPHVCYIYTCCFVAGFTRENYISI
jgi:hypothetical protein